jgi:hypothetical protein
MKIFGELNFKFLTRIRVEYDIVKSSLGYSRKMRSSQTSVGQSLQLVSVKRTLDK